MRNRFRSFRRPTAVLALASALCAAAAALAPTGGILSTTLRDFVQPGTQPQTLSATILTSDNCAGCHGNYDLSVEPYGRWAASMMAQATRDPIFHAALAIAEQDADFSGELCLRCHAPGGWLRGNSVPTDGSGLVTDDGDFDGVTCHFCHRMVDPVENLSENPAVDSGILAALGLPPTSEVHSGQFVIDPEDRRRGPYDLGPSFFWHDWEQSPFHQEALLCATCHDVSNPALSRLPDGSYRPNQTDAPHPTQNKLDEFPVERTFSEWKNSVYALAPIETGGRFGGNKTAVSSCQDCHMPDTTGTACMPGLGGTERDDLPLHDFNGANSWVLRAVHDQYPQGQTGLTDATVDDSIARNMEMLARSADLQAYAQGNELIVRIVNMSGHKLPTGYGEGRRMWVNVEFRDAGGQLVGEHGHYDYVNADLTENTRVYEIKHGLDDFMANLTGLPAGPSFHFVLNNTTLKDNRIPARGFNNQAYEDVQADVVDHTYPDEHYWDDVTFAIPSNAVRAEVKVFHQTTTKEYIEFLETENTTNGAGTLAKMLWEMPSVGDKSPPVLMAEADVDFQQPSCGSPVPYGLAGVTSLGERPLVGWNGTPSLAAANFELTLTDGVPNQVAAYFYGFSAQNVPYGTGSILVSSPIRGPIFMTDMNGEASVPVPVTPGMVGTQRFYQIFMRDPAAASFPAVVTDALFVEFCD